MGARNTKTGTTIKTVFMKNYTIDQYIKMVENFNKMAFYQKIYTIKTNQEIFSLGSDGNCWRVRLKDRDIEEELYEMDKYFEIKTEWDSSEIYALISMLGIDNTDY